MPVLAPLPRVHSPASQEVPAPGAEPPAPADRLDAGALARLRAIDPSNGSRLVERVLGTYRTSSARLRAQLQAARATGDRQQIQLVAHTFKSSSASIGAMRVAQLGAAIDQTIRSDPQATAESLAPELDALESALDAALLAIDRLLDGGA